MLEQQLSDDLPARPRSGFAAAADDTGRGKDGRKLGGATNPEFTKEYWTPERRAEQAEVARQRIREGTFGAANGFHRRKTKKFQEVAAEHAQQRAGDLITKLDGIIFGNGKISAQDRLRAIEMYMKMEDWAVKNSREDEKEFRAMTNDQLSARLAEILGEAMGLDLSDLFVDGEVVSEELVPVLVAGEAYDPMDQEVGGDRLRDGHCEACETDRATMLSMLREAGVDDEDEIEHHVALTRCVRHRVLEAVAVAAEDDDGDEA